MLATPAIRIVRWRIAVPLREWEMMAMMIVSLREELLQKVAIQFLETVAIAAKGKLLVGGHGRDEMIEAPQRITDGKLKLLKAF